MYKIVILQVIVAAAFASPIYPGGMGYGIGTVSVSRRTVVSPGMYGGGMMTPGMGVGVGMYGAGTMGLLVDEKTGKPAKTVAAPDSEVEGEKQTEVETPVDKAVEVVKSDNSQAPMGQMKSAALMGGVGVAPMMGGTAGSSRTDVVRAGIGGVQRSSVGESHLSTPFGSQSSVSSVQSSSGML